jgi:hypothetical protein
MRPFDPRQGLPSDLKHWQATVFDMLEGVDAPGVCYLMVDAAPVKAGDAHRRPGVHVEGYWCAESGLHRGDHRSVRGDWDGGKGKWGAGSLLDGPEATLLAASVTGAAAYAGQWEGDPGERGDCSHVALDGLERIALSAGVAWHGNEAMLHESIPVLEDCLRTVVRITVPGWSPAA